jgi:Flp pilus assembly protein TadD
MPFVSPISPQLLRRGAILATVTSTVLLGACASGGSDPLVAGAQLRANEAANAAPKSELQKATEYWGKAHAENPTDPRAAVNYARNLKALGAKQEALAILQVAHQRTPTDRELNSEYGRLALEHQQFTVAEKLLAQADDPVNPDWRTVSARGAAMAKQGRHHEAVPFFQRAMELAPDQASIRNNLAMAYAMAGQPDKAEPLLREAAAKSPDDPRIAQNLALVLGLQGRHEEAKQSAAGRVPEETLAHNADIVRQMVPKAAPQAMADAAPTAEPAPATAAARQAQPAAVKGRSTAAIPAKATTKPAGKTAAKTDDGIDPAELVRRLADGDELPPAAEKAAPKASKPMAATPTQGPFPVQLTAAKAK